MNDSIIHISDLNKADVLAALYNAAKPQGMGFMQYDPAAMSREEAHKLLTGRYTLLDRIICFFTRRPYARVKDAYFDYLKGRVMKVNLKGDKFDPRDYNRDNGPMAAEMVIARLREDGDVNPAETQEDHRARVIGAAHEVHGHLGDKSRWDGGVLHLGLADVADQLGPKVADALEAHDAPVHSKSE